MHGFIVLLGAVLPPMVNFADDVGPLVTAGKISAQYEHRFTGLREAVTALNAVHTGGNKGKAVIVVDESGMLTLKVMNHWIERLTIYEL